MVNTLGKFPFLLGFLIVISPGRFFAVNEIKVMLAFMLLRYDFRLDGVRPPNSEFRGAAFPSTVGKVLFRRRKAA